MRMEVIHSTKRTIGSFDWELPEEVAKAINDLPEAFRPVVRKEIELRTITFLQLIVAAHKTPAKTLECLNAIDAAQIRLVSEISEIYGKA